MQTLIVSVLCVVGAALRQIADEIGASGENQRFIVSGYALIHAKRLGETNASLPFKRADWATFLP